MAQIRNTHQAASPQMRGLIDVLDPLGQAALQEVLRAAPTPTGDAQSIFFGDPYFVSAFELLDGKILHLEETPSAEISKTLVTAGDADTFCTHGTLTFDHLIICFGLADWAGRLLVITKASFEAFLRAEWPEAAVTAAERHMLSQLLIGQSPAQAALADGLAYETKRTYVKSLCHRLNVSGQVELVSAVLGRLLIAINAIAADVSSDTLADPLHAYRKNFLPTSSRVLQLLDGQGEKIKILDIGPHTGRPVFFAHSTILPFFSEAFGERLAKLNLRLLVPLRPGVFDPQAEVMSPSDYIDRTLEGLALCKSLLVGPDAPVLGLSNGGCWAVRFAQKYPELAPKVFLASMTFQTPKDGSLHGRFLTDFSAMVAKRPALISLYVDFLLLRHKDPVRFRKMNDKVFPPETVDGQAMTWEFSQQGALEAYMHFYHTSPSFLKSDAHTGYYVDADDIHNLSSNVHMLHGVENTRDDIASIRRLAATATNTQLTELPGAGQVLRGPHLDSVWDLLANSN